MIFQFEFGLTSCFHEHTEDIVIRVSMGYVSLIVTFYIYDSEIKLIQIF